MSERQNPSCDLKSEKRDALLAALARAQGDNVPPGSIPDEPDGEGNGYYILTKEELTALLSGNMEKIENWVGQPRQAARDPAFTLAYQRKFVNFLIKSHRESRYNKTKREKELDTK